jgi:hydroxymethylpyrimidine/phosphomethylpyrimidine kinase
VYADFAAAAETVLAIVREREMHVAFSAQWGIDLAELENTPESPACTAYGAYIMDIGIQGVSKPSFSPDVLTCDKATRRAF